MKKTKKNNSSISKAIKLFAVSMGVTAVTMLTSSGFIDYQTSYSINDVKEASLFNQDSYSAAAQANASENSIDGKTYVIPLGTSFGIKLFTDGVIVTSLTEIQSGENLNCPAQDAGIKSGDYILSVNGESVANNAGLAQLIGQSEGNPIQLKVRRGEDVFEATVTPVFSEGAFKTGMWIRDSAAGIGTLTFYNPDSGVFAGLGHGICDMDTNGIMELSHGEPAAIELSGIVKGEINKPGQLKGYFSSDESLGELLSNNETGVYGTFFAPPQGELMEVAAKEEVKTGDVEIIASIDGNGPKRYQAVIKKILSSEKRTKNLVIEVTDPALLSLTGGIVQGMSGCPIIQNGKIIGAVTHVFTEDPKTGYGIFADTMVQESVVFSMSK
ncbi:SpoIVB peptidase [Scatolibacter rhodanostii]|uniref:SpoIVB peptidase n=1 Tax=Scatolibacter rhodanostii TaxID=2014781 RepID=UPI000C072C11|nr:SpoIVB peptidase [Scatolibacter rhodanostii]